MSAPRWSPGEVVIRREVWRGKPWAAIPVRVVAAADLLALYLAEATPLGFADGDWPGGRHPWYGKERWRGHGVVMLHPPGEAHSIWVFWRGPERDFAGWYVNFQAPLRRWEHGVDTLDHELDIWIPADGTGWVWKDRDRLEERVADGRFTRAEADAILADGERVAARLDRGEMWWDEAWAAWQPDPAWTPPELAPGWDA